MAELCLKVRKIGSAGSAPLREISYPIHLRASAVAKLTHEMFRLEPLGISYSRTVQAIFNDLPYRGVAAIVHIRSRTPDFNKSWCIQFNPRVLG